MSDVEKADARMRKASEMFLKKKTGRAYAFYGEALAHYGAGGPALRRLLAHYTRALLVVQGDAVGDALEDIEAGEALADANASEMEARRFRGLFSWLRASRARREDEFDEAEEQLGRAMEVLSICGRPIDRVEIEAERARLAEDRGMRDEAREAAEKAIAEAGSDGRLSYRARVLLADVEERAGRLQAAIDSLRAAADKAYDAKLVDPRHAAEKRIAELEARLEQKPST